MWRAERRRSNERTAGRQQSGDGVDPRDLERLLRRETGQDAGKPTREHRLPRARRAREQEIVAPGSCDLERAPPTLLATDVFEIGMRDGGRAVGLRLERGRLAFAPQIRHGFREMAKRHRLDACERRLGCGARGAEQPLEPALAGALGGGEHSAHRPYAAVERQFADGGVPVQALAWDLVRRREHGEGDGQVEAGALLPQARRREVHRDPVPRPFETCCSHARPHSMLRLLAGAVCKADDREAWQSALDVRLHLHAPRVEADESVSDRAREHTTERSRGLRARLPILCSESGVRLRPMSLWLWIALGVLVVLGLYVVYAYNSLVRVRNEAETGWANIDVQLRRRTDLIPNLVEAVKGYAAHEREVFDEVTRARAAVMSASGPQAAAEANTMLGAALGRLFAVAEAYPQLRASENFMQLQEELTDTEDKIAAARRYYNATVLRFNTRQQTFPTLIVARLFRFSPREFFEAGEDADAPVGVTFDRR